VQTCGETGAKKKGARSDKPACSEGLLGVAAAALPVRGIERWGEIVYHPRSRFLANGKCGCSVVQGAVITEADIGAILRGGR